MKWLLRLLSGLGQWAQKTLTAMEQCEVERTALPLGTLVWLKCKCHRGQLFRVVSLCSDLCGQHQVECDSYPSEKHYVLREDMDPIPWSLTNELQRVSRC